MLREGLMSVEDSNPDTVVEDVVQVLKIVKGGAAPVNAAPADTVIPSDPTAATRTSIKKRSVPTAQEVREAGPPEPLGQVPQVPFLLSLQRLLRQHSQGFLHHH